jgi:hypothetical protein
MKSTKKQQPSSSHEKDGPATEVKEKNKKDVHANVAIKTTICGKSKPLLQQIPGMVKPTTPVELSTAITLPGDLVNKVNIDNLPFAQWTL